MAIGNAQQAANNEEKSSAGDKYETGRAMSHLEKICMPANWQKHQKELAMLREINTDIIYSACTAGAFVQCVHESFFIAAGLGKQIVDGRPFSFIALCTTCKIIIAQKSRRSFFV
jgi:hypothetical protein